MRRNADTKIRIVITAFFYRFFELNVRHFLFFIAPTAPPSNVRVTKRSERRLAVSWNKPDARIWSGITTRYQICYSTQQRASRPTCKETNRLSYEVTSLQPSTKYFVTVSAGNNDGFGTKSAEISQITNGGMNLAWVRLNQISLDEIKVCIGGSTRYNCPVQLSFQAATFTNHFNNHH